MENKDQPAFAFEWDGVGEDGNVGHFIANGLTKREYFAGLAMQSLIPIWVTGKDKNLEIVAEQSIKLADELLKQLEHA